MTVTIKFNRFTMRRLLYLFFGRPFPIVIIFIIIIIIIVVFFCITIVIIIVISIIIRIIIIICVLFHVLMFSKSPCLGEIKN